MIPCGRDMLHSHTTFSICHILPVMNSPKTRYPSDKFSQKKIREHRRRDSMNRELNAMKNLVISKSNGKNDGKKLEPAMILEAFTELYMNTKDEIEKVKKENAELESELGYQQYQPEISPKNTAEFSEINNTPTTTSSGSNDTAISSSAGDESVLQASQIFSATEEPPNLPIPPFNMPIDPFQPMNLMTQPNFFPILPPQLMVQPNFPLLYQFQALQQQMALQNMMSGPALTFQTIPQPTTSQEQLNLLLLQNMLQNSLSQQNICNNE
ncbi:unnamed protein product [Bursaphelenchus xylophilus]|uniref:(pine wood nematode) hypothetical protein n=1 Tax=Bursaphelenchus xylophilus TaxID=6326 RepID=A0A7I8X8F0_BURXY|nr:unnamed protein product [Bursaphelenchus xylophilus]CAG9126143.1 unnamed protein product [Bursaphelenchus xylophilus]